MEFLSRYCSVKALKRLLTERVLSLYMWLDKKAAAFDALPLSDMRERTARKATYFHS